MAINGVSYLGTGVNELKAQQALANYQKYEQEQNTEDAESCSSDSYTKSGDVTSCETGIYSKENIKKTVSEIEEQRAQAMQNMICEMLNMQTKSSGMSYLNLSGDSSLSVSLDDITSAEESVSDGGYWSVDSVAGRIMDMAKLLAGDDTSKLDTLKAAVIKGFGKAASQLGKDSLDDMPDITRQTYTEVMNRFDKWSEEVSSSEE